jgi:hypothetical protein
MQIWVVEITHILYAHLLVHILQHIDVFPDLFHEVAFILVFLKQDIH